MSVFQTTPVEKVVEPLTATDANGTGDTAVAPGEAGTGEEIVQAKPVEIVLKGPLSHVYTQALNVLYAKESLAQEDMTAMLRVTKAFQEQEGEDVQRGAFVYVADASTMTQTQVVDAHDEILQFRETNPDVPVIVGLESRNGVSKAASLFANHLKPMGAVTYFSRGAVMEAVARLVR